MNAMTGPDVVKNAAVAAEYEIDNWYARHDEHDTTITVGKAASTAGRFECNTCKTFMIISVLTSSGPIPKEPKDAKTKA